MDDENVLKDLGSIKADFSMTSDNKENANVSPNNEINDFKLAKKEYQNQFNDKTY